MKNSLLIATAILLLSCRLSSQTVIGKIVDEDNSGLADITLNLYISPNVYNTTTSANGSFSFTVTEVKYEQLPTGYAISNNFPNPFNPKTRIGITLPNSGVVKIEVFNLLGESVAEAIENIMDAGTNFVDIELNGLPNGIYLLRIKIDEKYTVVKKVMLIYGSQHLSVTDGRSNTQLNKGGNSQSTVLDITIDSLVATSTIIGRKTFTGLPQITGSTLDLGNLIIERFCPETPTVLYAGKLYHTVKIGSQCWLKENLNVGTMINSTSSGFQQTNNGIIEKYCYDNDSANCETYGGLYEWPEAMQYSTTPGVQGICPVGWHIPTYAELQALASAVSNNGNALKAIGQGSGSGQGTNESGFSALLAGFRHLNGNFGSLGYFAYFWSSTENHATYPYLMYLYANISYIHFYNLNKDYGFSVRCLKD